MKTTAPQLLNKAAVIMEQRGKQYDKPGGERSMGSAVAALNTVLGRTALTESEGWLLLQIRLLSMSLMFAWRHRMRLLRLHSW